MAKIIINKNFLKTAIKAAKKAGKIHQAYFRKKNVGTKIKGETFDLVTNADIEAEKEIRKIIRKKFPLHNFLGEEQGLENNGSEYTWIIDPLDGTNNFASGLPIFCVSIALAKKDTTIVGVIYDVSNKNLYWATKSGGAFLNKQKLSVSQNKTLQRSLLITGFYYDRGKKMQRTLKNIEGFFQKGILGMRRLGSAALDLCFVASGCVVGFWEFELNPWDFAAGMLIVQEAGGKVTDNQNKRIAATKKSYIVAANKTIHKEMLKNLK